MPRLLSRSADTVRKKASWPGRAKAQRVARMRWTAVSGWHDGDKHRGRVARRYRRAKNPRGDTLEAFDVAGAPELVVLSRRARARGWAFMALTGSGEQPLLREHA